MKRKSIQHRMALVIGAVLLAMTCTACGGNKDDKAGTVSSIQITGESAIASSSEEIPSSSEEDYKEKGETEILRPGVEESKASEEGNSQENSSVAESSEASSEASETASSETSSSEVSSSEAASSQESSGDSKVVIELPMIPISSN